MAKNTKQTWGLMPPETISELRRKEWDNSRHLKARLKGERPFPIELSLRPPTGSAALAGIEKFQQYVAAWHSFSEELTSSNEASTSCGIQVVWEERRFKKLGNQLLPTKIRIIDMAALTSLLGEEPQLQHWLGRVTTIGHALLGKVVAFDQGHPLYGVLVSYFAELSCMTDDELARLTKVIPQLKKGMGQGGYLRSLPILHVDTKFLENHLSIVEAIAAVAIDPQIVESGLLAWLACQAKPMAWLMVRPLCPDSRRALGGLPLLRLSSDTLTQFPLPTNNILVVENEQSCLALPPIADVIAVAGGGSNVSWLSADWLADKKVGYWGDIDAHGLAILGSARGKLAKIEPMMMDRATVEAFSKRMVEEPEPSSTAPSGLTVAEEELYRFLRKKACGLSRLEQERIPQDYIKTALEQFFTRRDV